MAYIREQAGRLAQAIESWRLDPSSTRWTRYLFSAALCRPGPFAASRVPQCQNQSHCRPWRMMPWESRVAAPVVQQPPCRCHHGRGLSTRSSSSLLPPNPVVRYAVSSILQTSNESERPARRDSYRQTRRPNVRGDRDELSATTTNAIVINKKVGVGLAYEEFYSCFK
jgi:hypothetical protein